MPTFNGSERPKGRSIFGLYLVHAMYDELELLVVGEKIDNVRTREYNDG